MIDVLLGRARSRFIVNEALAQLAFAAAVAAGGFALLLVFGTQYLDWWSVLLLTVAALVLGGYRVFRRVPSRYAIALQLDYNLALQDTLSTAVHFAKEGAAREEFFESQRRQAEQAAESADLDRAIPFTMPRALYAMAGLALLATGLVAVRYGVAHKLDLRAPLTQVFFEDQEDPALAKAASKTPAKNKAARENNLFGKMMEKFGIPLGQNGQKPPDPLDQAIQQALQTPGGAAMEKGNQQKGEPAGAGKEARSGSSPDKPEAGDPLDGSDARNAAQSLGENPPPGAQDGPSGDKAASKEGSSGGESPSLLSKLKDAVSNMLSKARQDGGEGKKGQAGQQQAKSEKGKTAGEKGSAGKSQQQGQSQADSQEGDPNGDPQNGQQAQGKAGSKDASQQASSQPGSGIGKQDGSKDLKAAEQLKAMGKLSEIIGKRASTVTGETSVEVESGSQQLRTAYSKTNATHSQTDGDANRDEVPVELQSYVQKYFAQVRKSVKSEKKAATATP